MDDQNLDPTADPQENQTGSNSASGDSTYDALQEELKDTQQKLEEMTGIGKRALADLQNYKRRVEEEKAAFIAFANAALFSELLPAIENINRALTHEPKDEEWIKGATETMKQVTAVCEKNGLKIIPAQNGDTFNPNLHEALLTAPGPKDQILEILENGYTLGERVIKPARVKVGNGE